MGGRASRRGKSNDINDTFRYDALPPGTDFDLGSLDESSSTSSSSPSETRMPQTKLSFGKTKTLNAPITRIHQYNHADQAPLNPAQVLEHLVRETLPTLSETPETETFFAENRFAQLESAKEDQSSVSSSNSDSGDLSIEQSIKVSDQEEEHADELSEIDVQSINDYQRFCAIIRPQLEALLNGYTLQSVPFTYLDYKRLLAENGVDNLQGILERGLSIKYEPQIVVLQGEDIVYSPDIDGSYLPAYSQSVYYVDGKCLVGNDS